MEQENNTRTVIGMVIQVVIILLLIGTVAGVVTWGITKFNAKKQETTSQVDEIELMKFTSIEGREVTGNSVTSYLSQWKNQEVCITVKTKKNTTSYNYTDKTLGTPIDATKNRENITNASLKKKANFINPNGKFLCTIERDENDSIVEILFVQQ